MKLRGGCIHHDNAMLGACAYPDAECRKIRRLKDAGYNAIRTAHNPPSSALLTACDQIGMLVLDESFDMWRTGKNPMDYHLWFEDWWKRDTAAMVKRDRNHPCIYCWSIGNEIGEMLGTSNGAYWARVPGGLRPRTGSHPPGFRLRQRLCGARPGEAPQAPRFPGGAGGQAGNGPAQGRRGRMGPADRGTRKGPGSLRLQLPLRAAMPTTRRSSRSGSSTPRKPIPSICTITGRPA